MDELNQDKSKQGDILLPCLRDDISFEVIEEDSEKFVVFSDPLGFAEQPIALHINLVPYFQMMNGTLTLQKLKNTIKEQTGQEPDINPFIELVHYLEAMGFMQSPAYELFINQLKEYKNSSVRKPVCAGMSYSNEPEKLRIQLESILSSVSPEKVKPGAKSIIVPHIDFLIGESAAETYSAGYNALRGTEPDIFVILGTAHRRSTDHFMFTEKDFETPLGLLKTDKDMLDALKRELPFKLTIDDLAHFREHSIELQLLLIQKMFEGKEFTILPVLIGSFNEFILSGNKPSSDSRFLHYVSSLNKVIESSGKNAIYIVSVDFGHIGRRFEHDFDAEEKLQKLKDDDTVLINKIVSGDSEGFFDVLTKNRNQWNVCGVSPVYSLLQLTKPKSGEFLKYNQWNDMPTASAVSFASIAFY